MPTFYTHVDSNRIFLDKNDFLDHPRAREIETLLNDLSRWGGSDYESVNSIGWEFRADRKLDAIRGLELFGFELAID